MASFSRLYFRGLIHSPELRFRRANSGGIEELRGPENRPLVQPVKFGTKPYAIEDSKDTIAWKETDSNHLEREH